MPGMTESDARAVLLVRAFEAGPSPDWSETDGAWATAEARRVEGERAPFERFIVRRAVLACARLAQHDPKVVAVLPALDPRAWVGWAALLVAFGLGVASDAIGPTDRINILAPPLLAVLVWNLVVYLVLVLRPAGASGPLQRWLLRMRSRSAAAASSPLARFAPDWAAASGALYGARFAAVLHAGAAALVLGAFLSLYLRGIAFEYRAGWDSTFLTADSVHRLITIVLGPAAHLSGIDLPDVDQLARLRFSLGSGVNAAPWIHLYAITMGLAVVLPRTILAAVAVRRARAMTRDFPLALDGDDFARLRRALSGEPIEALVLPYSYRLSDSAGVALKTALERITGPNVSLSIAPPLPQGAEDEMQDWLGAAAARPKVAALVVALFPLTATPERETHGAFVRALVSRKAARLLVVVDEAEFRRRFTGADGARRLGERREAWSRMLGDTGVEAVFVDLAAGVPTSKPGT